MKLPEIGEGIAFGVGKTNYRTALVEADGALSQDELQDTPKTPEEFFAQTAHQLLEAAHVGAKWGVLGVPGPVSVQIHPDGTAGEQRLRITNIQALNRENGFNPIEEMVKADPAADELFRSPDFDFLTVNDGDLAAQAAAQVYGLDHDVVGDVINGSGTGGAVARRDKRFPGLGLFHPDAGLWELGHEPVSTAFPSQTLETTISGEAIAARAGKSAGNLPDEHPIFQEVGSGIGQAVFRLGIYGGAELVVVSGGVAVARQSAYKDELNRALDRFANSSNPMADKVPDVEFVPHSMKDTYELHGAHGIMRSLLTRRAIDQLVAQAD